MARRRRIRQPNATLATSCLALALAIGSSGCVRAYQPMSGLHQPVVVDPRAPNLQDLSLTVHCVPGDYVSRYEAALLCRRLGQLFENQGARVETVSSVGRPEDEFAQPPRDEEEEGPEVPQRTDLVLELRARKVHGSNHPLSWVLCVVSFSLWPATTESTFAQDIAVRDGEGFLLVEDSVEGRLVQQYGAGTWAVNGVLDLVAREPEDRLTRANAEGHLSADLYGQLSQLVYNAKVQRQLLLESAGKVPR